MLLDILEWFYYNLPTFFIILIFVLYVGLMVFLVYDGQQNPAPEYIKRVSEGELINMRFLGSWYSNTELKFNDGSMTVVPFWFSRQLRIGNKYKIWYSSKTGWQYEEIK